MKISYKKLALFSLVAILVSWVTKPTWAQTSPPIDLAISPPVTYLNIKPGQHRTYEVKLEQKGSLSLDITPSFVDFAPDGETNQPQLSNQGTFPYLQLNSDNAAQSATDENPSFKLVPKQTLTIKFDLDIPKDAKLGEYPISLIFFAKPNADLNLDSSGGQVSAAVASNLIVNISNSPRDRGELSVNKIINSRFQDSLFPISFQILAKNDGANATTASGSARLIDWQGRERARFSFYPDMILAASTRLLRHTGAETASSPNSALPASDPKAIEKLSPNFLIKPPFIPGTYQIEVKLNQNGQTTEAATLTEVIYVIPISIIAVVLLMGCLYLGYRTWYQKFDKPDFF